MKDNLYIKEEARQGIIRGIRKCAEAVGGTMGTGGSNALIECVENPGHFSTNDGVTILEHIYFADPLEEMGRKILLEAVKRANKQSGDGSSTTTILTAAIIEEGLKYIEKHSPMDIKKSLESLLSVIEKSIESQKREITVDTVSQVASISAEDTEIGNTIQEIYQQIGPDGIIHWDISKTYQDTYTIGSGITIDGAGFASPYMADLDENTGAFQNVARWKNAKILITKQKITSASEFNSLFETLFNKEIKEIVVFCDEYEPNIIADLIRTRAMRGFKTLLVKMPVLFKDWWYEDLAKATGATVIDPHAGISHKMMTVEHLGHVENITVTQTDTYLDGINDLTEHIKVLQDEGTDDSILRASKLNTKTARYFVGAASDSALSYRRLKVEDAISAAHQAIKNGVVAGGGITLVQCVEDIKKQNTVGATILSRALYAPFAQILTNVGIDPNTTLLEKDMGVDTRTKEQVNMFDAGIIDPANVILNACRNAVSVAASVLTCSTMIQLPRQDIADQLVERIMSRNP